jgi:hypothetical protein
MLNYSKILMFVTLILCSISAFAKHNFTVCIHNNTTNQISYDNNGLKHKWKENGQLVGTGTISTNTIKCFGGIADETLFSKDYITFNINTQTGGTSNTHWVGIVNPGFSAPYLVAQDATNKKGGKLTDHTASGKDVFALHVFVNQDGTFNYSNSEDINDASNKIEPRKLK